MPKAQHAVSASWDEVGTRFETFGEHVRQHFATGSAASAADRVQLEKSARALVAAVGDTLSAAGGVVTDTEVRQDLSDLADAIRTALVTSLDSAGTLIRAQVPQLDSLGHTRRETTAASTSKPKSMKSQPHKTATRDAKTRSTHRGADT
ncbi:MAG TPA: hypothetical protein VIG48_11930 [Jatrophihabitans sp.]|jgi:hypothetical protein